MATTVQQDILLDDSRNIIVKYDINCDAGDDLDNILLFDASSFFNKTFDKKVWCVEYELNGFSVYLEWFGTAYKQIITLEEGHHEKVDWAWFGGYPNTRVVGANGDIYISTNGITDGDRGYIILYIKNK